MFPILVSPIIFPVGINTAAMGFVRCRSSEASLIESGKTGIPCSARSMCYHSNLPTYSLNPRRKSTAAFGLLEVYGYLCLQARP